MCGVDATYNEVPVRKITIFYDNYHKNKAIFYEGLIGGAVYKQYQQNQ